MNALQRTCIAVTIVILAFSLIGISSQAQGKIGATSRFELKQVLIIGDDESASSEYLFRSPKHLRTDEDGRIYVTDRRDQRIRVFDIEGSFLTALGRRGAGPGEFRQISALALDSKARLVVYDRMSQRFTRFPSFEDIDTFPIPESERVKTFPNPEEYMISPQFMYGLPDGRFLLYYHPLANRSPRQPRLYVYDTEFRKVNAFGHPNKWSLPQDDFIDLLTRRFDVFSGHHVAPGTSDLLLGPWAYNGVLYRYDSVADGTWTLRRIEGQPPTHPTHEVLHYKVSASPSTQRKRRSRPDPPYKALNSTLENGKVVQSAARPKSMSRGIGQLSDGRIVHLSMKKDDNGIRQLQLELFGADGTLQRAGPIKRFEHSETEPRQIGQAVHVSLRWVDRRDRLYLVDYRSGVPVIRVMKLAED